MYNPVAFIKEWIDELKKFVSKILSNVIIGNNKILDRFDKILCVV